MRPLTCVPLLAALAACPPGPGPTTDTDATSTITTGQTDASTGTSNPTTGTPDTTDGTIDGTGTTDLSTSTTAPVDVTTTTADPSTTSSDTSTGPIRRPPGDRADRGLSRRQRTQVPAGEQVDLGMDKLTGDQHSACDHCGEFYKLVLEYDENGAMHHVEEDVTISCSF
jgi:hypothetical protein